MTYNYLLDTHAFLWSAIQLANLSAKARAIVSDGSQEVQVSVVTFWEIGIKHALGNWSCKACNRSKCRKSPRTWA